ncbi:MAG TPA: NYN domain-containing protein [Thermoanaerobaculia bacterium]
MPDERVVIFVDGSNFYHCLKSEFGRADVDFSRLGERLCAGRRLIRTYYYNAMVRREDSEERYKAQQRFLDHLRQVAYLDVRLGRLERRGNTVVEKGIDVRVATDMLWQAHNNVYDTAILVSGDADYVPAVEAVKAIGKHVEVAFVNQGRSMALQQAADRFVPLDETALRDCWVVREA